MFEQTLGKWGNNLISLIPRLFATKTHTKEETELHEIEQKRRNKYTLEELLEGMSTDNFHCEVETGDSVGNESW
ncbi:MAG: AbrB/MazE/SpoVT family DNA-binding domain-containing protein [Cyanobacteriota bacterium]|nr:AbrB/MazE/SpoVT family DNA-binding domain-containing protein [Cyanobacteriota bacterium]